MTSTRSRTLAAAAAVAALTAGLAACGPDTQGSGKAQAAGSAGTSAAPSAASSAPAAAQSPTAVTPAAFLQQAGAKTSAQKSAKVTEDITTPTGEITGHGTMSWANGILGTMTMQLPSAASGKLGTDGAMDAVYQSDAMYVNMHMPQSTLAQMGGKHWFKYSYADLSKIMGAAGDTLKDGLKKADPLAAVQAAIASGKVTEVGKESLSGVATTHYTADLTLDQMSGQGVLSSAQVDALRQQLKSQGVTSAHYDVWVDGQGLLVKQETKSQTANGAIDLSVNYSDYGTQVTATPPPADDTLDAAQLLAQQGKQLGQPGQSGQTQPAAD
ncbi:hypothetical protein [Kitasatospora kifunensis]|uniref:Lipoprotein n=1 Tax=Kitasatospora kifunensis TaxID=58351 RepID=A0A7W7R4H4_KITKI|nr:hypothetical protein [Kitasatospora kifunensis]MBB4925179.1 hypothetical protein [Kitasatospora kifunensis]